MKTPSNYFESRTAWVSLSLGIVVLCTAFFVWLGALAFDAIEGESTHGLYENGNSVPLVGQHLSEFKQPTYCNIQRHPHGNFVAYVFTFTSDDSIKTFLGRHEFESVRKGADIMNSDLRNIPTGIRAAIKFTASDTWFAQPRDVSIMGAFAEESKAVLLRISGTQRTR